MTDLGSGNVVWMGRPPPGGSVDSVAPLEGSEDAIVILNREERREPIVRNLLRVRADGSVAWHAQLPSGSSPPDAYVDFDLQGERLFASTWSGYRTEIDLDTGEVKAAVFTK